MKKLFLILVFGLCIANCTQNNSQDDLYIKIINFVKANKTQFNEAIDLAMNKKFNKINGLYNKFCMQNSQICEFYDKENLGINPQRQGKIFDSICDRGESQDCKTLAFALKSFANGDDEMLLVVAIQGMTLLQKACDLGYEETCQVFSEMIK